MFNQTLLAGKKEKKTNKNNDKQECKMDREHLQVDIQLVLAEVNQRQVQRQAG